MRLHIELDDDLVARVDEIAGSRGRSAFVRRALEAALTTELRWRRLKTAAGAVPDTGHDWDHDPATWVRQQRRGDDRRGG